MKHDYLYNNLLTLSRNIYFYKNLQLPDTFETRIFLIFFHFSIILIIFKKKNKKFNQSDYNSLFNCIENDLRELGFGDIAVNKRMKNLNRFFYDILLKLEKKLENNAIDFNEKIIIKYFNELKDTNNTNFKLFIKYLVNFYEFCFKQSSENMIQELPKFKF